MPGLYWKETKSILKKDADIAAPFTRDERQSVVVFINPHMDQENVAYIRKRVVLFYKEYGIASFAGRTVKWNERDTPISHVSFGMWEVGFLKRHSKNSSRGTI